MIETEKDFLEWLDSQLESDIPDSIIAFNINIYESPFNIEIVGSNEYDPEDEDWACNEDWVPQNRMTSVSQSIFGESWNEAKNNILKMARAYIGSSSRNVGKLRAATAFTVGFVDGNLKHV